MRDATGYWAGSIYGTNTGNLFLELEEHQGRLKGTVRVNEPGTGVSVFEAVSKADDDSTLILTPIAAPDGVELSPGRAQVALQSDGSLSGRWETEAGTAGVFRAFPHDEPAPVSRESAPVPEQAFFHTAPIGAVRLYKTDLQRFVASLTSEFLQARPVVTYTHGGVEVTKFADAFLEDDTEHALKSLKISIQEPEPSGLARIINVDLHEGAGSQIRTSGSNESWVIGKAKTLQNLMRKHENKLVSWYRSYGMNINAVIFLLMLIAAPEIADWRERATFVGVVVLLLVVLAQIYNKLIPNTLIFAAEGRPTWWSRTWPTIVSWLAAMTSSLVAMWVFWLFTR